MVAASQMWIVAGDFYDIKLKTFGFSIVALTKNPLEYIRLGLGTLYYSYILWTKLINQAKNQLIKP